MEKGHGKDPEAADAPSPRVFLSYSRQDRARAVKIIRGLEAHGIAVWWDGMLEVGQAFAHSTETALETADAVVVLWSEAAVQSHWVRDEATRGRDRGCLVPVSLDGAQPPLGFRQIQYIKFSAWHGRSNAHEMVELVQALRATTAVPNRQLTFAASGLVPKRGLSRRSAIVLGAGGILATSGLAAWKGGLLGAAGPRNSVAILPFRNLSGDPAQSYFSDGLSEELRTTLSLNRGLEVAAQTSTAALRDQGKSLRDIAAALNVAFVLDGSVRRAADTVRIAARLIDGSSGFEKWAESFDRKADDVLAVQSEIAIYVADALAARTTAVAGIGRTKDGAAWDQYLRGRALFKLAASEATDRGALAAFDAALARDPKFALAHSARAGALWVVASTYASGAQARTLQQQAVEAANTAVRLAPDMAEGQFALGFVLSNTVLDQRAARLPFEKSVELGFGNADILTGFCDYASANGRFDDARKAIVRAQRLDPLNPSVLRTAAMLEFSSRNYAAAETALGAALIVNPKGGLIHRYLGDLRLLQHKYSEALEQYRVEPFAIMRLTGLAIAEMKLSGPSAGEARLAELVRQFGTNSYFQQIEIFAQWGRLDDALKALAGAIEQRDPGLSQLRNDPLLDPIRKTPQFAAAMSRFGFT